MQTPLVDLIVEKEVSKALDSFVTSFFTYDVATNIWVFPYPADAYGISGENMKKVLDQILDSL